MLKSTAQAARASQWIENKLKRSITKNMMYPACSDMKLPAVIPFDSPDVARPLPRAKSEAGGAPAQSHDMIYRPLQHLHMRTAGA
jgi:hypothetical protein